MFRTDSLTFAFLVQLLHRAHVLLDRAVRGTGSHVIAGGGVVRGGFHFQWTRGWLDNNITTLSGVCTEDLREEAGEHGSSDWLSVCTTRSCWVSLIDRSGRRSAERKFICTAVCDEKSCQRFSCTNVRLLLWREGGGFKLRLFLSYHPGLFGIQSVIHRIFIIIQLAGSS